MKKAILGMGAVLVAAAAFANDPQDPTKVAAVDVNSAAFAKLDADTDGRVSAIEAANDTKIAAAFTTADADKDGYLSKEEFATVGQADASAPPAQGTDPAQESPDQPQQ
jgi:Ca2+-binding EF-hand superfamily protein